MRASETSIRTIQKRLKFRFIDRLASVLFALAFILGTGIASVSGAEINLYVATNGDDQNPGTREKPFATVSRAQATARDILSKDNKNTITVQIKGGRYFLNAPLQFLPADSGTEKAPVTYKAWSGEEPILSGGVPLKGWKKNNNGSWEIHIPEVEKGEWSFSQLFVNGQRRLRPRLPKTGSYFIEKEATPRPGEKKASNDRLHFRDEDLRTDWHNLDDVELVVFHTWSASRMRIASVDPAARLATLTAIAGRNDTHWSGLRRNHRYFLENVREALGEPGEWYLDNKNGVLTYTPMPGETIANTTVIAPRLEHLLKIEANVEKGERVEHLRFEGLTFEHTNFVLPKKGYSCAQAEVTLDGAIRADGARHCVFQSSTIRQVARYGIQFNTGCAYNRVEDCDIYDLGGGGIQVGAKVGSGWFSNLPYGNLPKTEPVIGGHNEVVNCSIANGGRIFPASVGVWIGGSPYNRIAHNEIHDFFYTGISPGWVWGYNKSFAHHNVIEQNHIYDIGQRVLSDMGGIYTLGICPGTVLRYNHIHDVYSYGYGGWGIYFDEGTTYILAENNLAYRVKDGGFHQHYGRENWVRNNIFAFSEEAQVKRSLQEEHLSFEFTNNIVYWKGSDLLGGNLSDLKTLFFDYNLYWKEGANAIKFSGKSFKEWQAAGQDAHSLIADPLFVDPEAGDFRFRPGSPASKVGFVPFDISEAGRATPSRIPTGMTRPATPFHKMLPNQKPPPRVIREDFESLAVGAKVPGFQTHEENNRATVRVSDEHAASGHRSLKFTDAPSQKYGFNPHLTTDPAITDGTVTERFQLRLGPGAIFNHEWRTAGSPYKVGPSMDVSASGVVTSRGKKLGKLPRNKWIAVEMHSTIGSGKFSITLSIPEKDPLRFTDLPCDPEFNALRWIGFVSNATDTTTFYIDDLRLKRQN